MWSNHSDLVCHLFPVLINFCHLCLGTFVSLYEKKYKTIFLNVRIKTVR